MHFVHGFFCLILLFHHFGGEPQCQVTIGKDFFPDIYPDALSIPVSINSTTHGYKLKYILSTTSATTHEIGADVVVNIIVARLI